MKELLVVDQVYTVRGWNKLPYCLYHTKTGKTIFLDKAQFDLILMCAGKKEIDTDSLDKDQKQFLDYLKENGVIHPAKDGERRNLYYKYYDNIYKRSVQWSITGKCNYKCRHCFQSAPCGELMQPTLTQCKDIIRQLEQCGVASVGITGGEPLVHPDFLAIVDELIARNISISVIYSNGKLVTQELLDALKRRGIRPSFQISFDGVGYHDWMRGVTNAEKIALDAIRLLKDNGFGVSSAMVLCKDNIGSLRESVKVLAEAGCTAIKTQCASPEGLWKNQKEHFLSYDEILQAYIDYIPQYAEDKMPLSLQMEGFFMYDKETEEYSCPADTELPSNFKLKYTKLPVCEVIHNSFYLGPSGNVVPCMMLDQIEMSKEFPNIFEMPLQQILSDSSYTEAMSLRVKDVIAHNEECRDCEYKCRCCAGCRAFAAVDRPDDYLAIDKITCKILKEHWNEKLYAVADRYFKRKLKGDTENDRCS